MSKEISRKFFPKVLPDTSSLKKSPLDRYFLYNQDGVELRIQSNGQWYKMQRKESVSDTTRETQEWAITAGEFENLKQAAIANIQRESYHLADVPETDLRIYKGRFEGLVRLEFEFASQEECDAFVVEDWMGKEITKTPLARDGYLLKLTPEDFARELEQLC